MIHLQYGTRITSPDDELQKVALTRIHQGIVQPKPTLSNQIKRLRMVRAMDERQYARLKRDLPYFVCGHFYPARRRKEHFSSIDCFVVDLDHFQRSELRQAEVRQRLQQDERLLLLFTSPSGDGLKLLFRLAEKCFDPGLYSFFYKAFVQQLAQQYELAPVVDLSTHDVARACFLSTDPHAYLNLEAQPVVLEHFFDPLSPEAPREVHEGQQALRDQAPPPVKDAPERDPLNDEVLLAIKQRLNPNFRPRQKQQPAYVPPELESQMEAIGEKLAQAEIELREAQPIQYGKKLLLAAGPYLAEINIFFGKRGFSVVKTTKTGTHAELAELAYQIICEHLIP